jgi:hypothetical protein
LYIPAILYRGCQHGYHTKIALDLVGLQCVELYTTRGPHHERSMGTNLPQHPGDRKLHANERTYCRVSECSQRCEMRLLPLSSRSPIHIQWLRLHLFCIILYRGGGGLLNGPDKDRVVPRSPNVAGIKPNSTYFSKIHNFQY